MPTPGLPVDFSSLPIGLNPLNLFDEQFAAAQLITGGGSFLGPGSLSIVTTAGPFTITNEDWLVLNKGSASATTINLPTVASRAGRPLRVTDWAGNAGDITIIPNGSETIMGLASAVLGSNGQGIGTAADVTLSPSTDLSGWLVS